MVIRFILAFSFIQLSLASAYALDLNLTTSLTHHGKRFNATLLPSESTEGCTYTLYGSTSRTAINSSPTSQRLLYSIGGSENSVRLRASSLSLVKNSRKRRSPKVFFVAIVSCDSQDVTSNVETATLRRSDRGTITDGKAWLKQLKRKLVASNFTLVKAFPSLSFTSPVDLQNAGDGTNRLFVVEQTGRIRVFQNSSSTTSSSVFLDIRDKVVAGGEQGLLGLAFHPSYASNGFFYVNYTKAGNGNTIIARYQRSNSDPNSADASSELVLLEVEQPFDNHNGGQVAFGPDGYLYIALGDGGSGGDPLGNGQDRSALLGKLLRIDVDNPTGGRNYGIPTDNPFAGNSSGFKEEIYAYGLRNPWRFSFDRPSGRLWLADVGQNAFEEVDVIESGKNYGWNTMEGNACFNPSSGCDTSGLELPIVDYSHDLGISVTGGYVYRGSLAPGLTGLYIYGDFSSGRIWALDLKDTGAVVNSQIIQADNFLLSSFGIDENKELYLCEYGSGDIYSISD